VFAVPGPAPTTGIDWTLPITWCRQVHTISVREGPAPNLESPIDEVSPYSYGLFAGFMPPQAPAILRFPAAMHPSLRRGTPPHEVRASPDAPSLFLQNLRHVLHRELKRHAPEGSTQRLVEPDVERTIDIRVYGASTPSPAVNREPSPPRVLAAAKAILRSLFDLRGTWGDAEPRAYESLFLSTPVRAGEFTAGLRWLQSLGVLSTEATPLCGIAPAGFLTASSGARARLIELLDSSLLAGHASPTVRDLRQTAQRRLIDHWWPALLRGSFPAVESDDAPRPSDDRPSLETIIGGSAAMQPVYRSIESLAASDLPVLVLGQTGTGKELTARALHTLSTRSDGPWEALNCAAVPHSSAESELFGHMRGAFTHAHEDHRGAFERAHGGTLFLDEIGELSPELQRKLLRVLQEGELRPVGAEHLVQVDVRIVSATRQPLDAMVRAGAFREDLWYRINVAVIQLPTLEQRSEDVPQLADHFAATHGLTLTPSARGRLLTRAWPGNVRELAKCIDRCAVFATDGVISTESLELGEQVELGAGGQPGGYQARLDALGRSLILAALHASGGNKQEAAKLLQLPRGTFYKRLDQLKIEFE
jgi:transcriptional regulator with AAA-type ATPase domain